MQSVRAVETRRRLRSATGASIAAALALVVLVVASPSSASRSVRALAAKPALRTIEHRIARGESFSGVLAAHGVSTAEASRWHTAVRPKADLRHVEVGRVLHLQFDPDGSLRALRYELARGRTLVAERARGQDVVARIESQPVQTRAVGIRATVRTSFLEAAHRAGIPKPIISQMIDLLSWKLSFKSDVHRGDHLRVLYEERLDENGQRLAPGHVLAVDYRGRAESVAAYLYAEQDGEPVYADDEGHLLDAAPLRFPLEFTRITSTFSDARMHPILKRERAHLGIDFAAPTGTPVRAVAPGVVKFRGVQSGFGNHVEIDHGADFVSAYSHLNGIEPRVQNGTRVQRGQLLGWVGQTGLATGPHLHFAIFDRGQYVDPLTLKFPPQVLAVDPGRFSHLRDDLLAQLRAIPRPAPAAPNAPEIGAPPLAQAGRPGPITRTF